MATVIGALRYDITADTSKFTSKMKASRQELAKGKTAMKQFSTATKLAGAAAAGFALIKIKQGLSSAVRSNEEFQQSMASSLAMVTTVSDEMRAKLVTAAQQIAFNTKFSSAEAAESIQFLNLAGLNLEQTLHSMPLVAKFAQAGMFDMATATDIATDSQLAFRLDSKDTITHLKNLQRVTDAVAMASSLSNAQIEQFGAALTGGAGVAARQLGMDIEETLAVLAVFAAQGFAKGTEAGTQFGIVLRDVKNKAIENAAAFKEHGIEVFKDSGAIRKMTDIIRDMEKALGPLEARQKTIAMSQLGFQIKSQKSTEALMGFSEQIKLWEAGILSAGGKVDEMSSKQLPALTAAIAKLKATWDVFVETAINPIVLSVATEGEGGMSVLVESLATLLDLAQKVQIAFVGMDIALQAVQGTVKSMMGSQFDFLSGLIPGVGLSKLGIGSDIVDVGRSAFNVNNQEAASFNASVERFNTLMNAPSRSEAFRARMAEVGKPLDSDQIEAKVTEEAVKKAIETAKPNEALKKDQEEIKQLGLRIVDGIERMGLLELVR